MIRKIMGELFDGNKWYLIMKGEMNIGSNRPSLIFG